MEKFLWVLGEGYDISAVKRLQENFAMPVEPMGEAWFNTHNRKMYDYLLEDIDTIAVDDLMSPLGEIASGISCFGHEDKLWHPWFHYLMGQLIRRNHEYYTEYLLEYLITAFISQYPEGIHDEPYKGFKDDAINTLGKCIMDAECWSGKNIVMGKILCSSNNNPARYWGWRDASGDFSASMFFCLKYLDSNQILDWFRSALEIESPHWRAQMIVWLVGANKLLNGAIKQPSEFKGNPSVEWSWSHVIDGFITDHSPEEKKEVSYFISEENRVAFLETVHSSINEEMYLDWMVSISEFDYIEAEIAGIPHLFEELYLNK